MRCGCGFAAEGFIAVMNVTAYRMWSQLATTGALCVWTLMTEES